MPRCAGYAAGSFFSRLLPSRSVTLATLPASVRPKPPYAGPNGCAPLAARSLAFGYTRRGARNRRDHRPAAALIRTLASEFGNEEAIPMVPQNVANRTSLDRSHHGWGVRTRSLSGKVSQ